MLHTSGIGPVLPDGTVPDALDLQAGAVWATLLGLLAEADMTVADVVSVTTYAVGDPGAGDRFRNDLGLIMAARDEALAGHRCSSTLVPVAALASPEWKMEIAVVAARS